MKGSDREEGRFGAEEEEVEREVAVFLLQRDYHLETFAWTCFGADAAAGVIPLVLAQTPPFHGNILGKLSLCNVFPDRKVDARIPGNR